MPFGALDTSSGGIFQLPGGVSGPSSSNDGLVNGGFGTGFGTDPTTPVGVSDQNPSGDLTVPTDNGTGGASDANLPSGLSKILQSMGLVGANGDINPLMLASLLGPLASGLISGLSTSKATSQVEQGITNAQNAVQKSLGGANPFASYSAMGNQATSALPGLTFKPTNFTPLGQPAAGAAPASLSNLYAGKKG